jgi:cytochrome b561/polyisoprenoid-binding protein YceI
MTAAAIPAGARAQRYSAVAIVLHWTIALAIVLQIVLSGRMEGPHTPESFAVTQLHKSVGITVLLLSLVRLAWRLTNPPPPEPASLARWERLLSQAVHWGFYAIMIGMPLTGWLMVSASRTEIPTLLYGVVHWPNLPGFADMAPAAKKAWHAFGLNGHHLIAKLIYGLLALHVAGALKHQLFSRNEPVLSRMAPGAVAGRWVEPRLIVIAAAVLGVIAFGRLVQPPRPASGPPPVAAAPAEAAAPAPVAPPAAPAATAAAPPPAGPATPAAPSGPVTWKVARGSTLSFATAWSGDPIQGRFERWTAAIAFSPDALDKSKVSVSIDMASARTGDEQRDASLPAPDWFDSAAHPKATFTATKFEKAGADRYVAHGSLSLRGVTKPIDLPFRLTITGNTAKVAGETSLDRTQFGVGQGEFTATDQVPAKVTVRVELTATRDQR